MDYEKKYKEALDRARQFITKELYAECNGNLVEYIFPELKEVEDEKIRKELIGFLRNIPNSNYTCEEMAAWLEKQGEERTVNYPIEGMFPYTDHADTLDGEIENIWNKLRNCDNTFTAAKSGFYEVIHHFANWLEKQGEQKPADKIEPKFHEGEWIISNDKKSTYQVIEVKRGIYVIRDNVDNHEYHIGIEECEKSGRLFTIQDAKDGDVLQLGVVTVIFQEYIGNGNCKCYYSVCNGEFEIPTKDESYGTFNATPATKEQRNTLERAMTNAGYRWDKEKLKLEKI